MALEGEWIICGCCGHLLRNTAQENAHFGQQPYPDDEGYGMCMECGGEKGSPELKKRLGWAGCMFFDARIEVLKPALNPENLAKFEAMSYERKVAVITRLIEKGAMI
jgi:hypothetical protein